MRNLIELTPKQIYRMHENEKKRMYNQRVTDIEQGTFTPLIFTTTGGMGEECKKYQSISRINCHKEGGKVFKNNGLDKSEDIIFDH